MAKDTILYLCQMYRLWKRGVRSLTEWVVRSFTMSSRCTRSTPSLKNCGHRISDHLSHWYEASLSLVVTRYAVKRYFVSTSCYNTSNLDLDSHQLVSARGERLLLVVSDCGGVQLRVFEYSKTQTLTCLSRIHTDTSPLHSFNCLAS